ncbi:hypothetical protein QQ045_022479 [Rhodiola kirilowii]
MVTTRSGCIFPEKRRSYKHNRDRLVNKLKPGDHIAANRTMVWSYEHHGIYEGEGKGYPSVVHFQGPLIILFHILSQSQRCVYDCGYEHQKEGNVVTSCIDCFSQGRSMFKMQYMLHDDLLSAKDEDWNELTDGKLIPEYRSEKFYLEHYKNGQLHGHSIAQTKKRKRSKLARQVMFYSEFSIRTSEEVLKVAREYQPPEYSLVCNNCEHFAVYCKTGKKMSRQSQIFNAENRLCPL